MKISDIIQTERLRNHYAGGFFYRATFGAFSSDADLRDVAVDAVIEAVRLQTVHAYDRAYFPARDGSLFVLSYARSWQYVRIRDGLRCGRCLFAARDFDEARRITADARDSYDACTEESEQ